MNDLRAEIEEMEQAFEVGNLDRLKELLPPLVAMEVPAAIRIASSFFEPGTPEEECDRIYVKGMFRAAELGDPRAKYQVGIFYDLGEYGVPQDKVRAANIFKELAEGGDVHCMWIYACELIWGAGSFPKSTGEGLNLLKKSALGGSAGACMTIAQFHDQGEFGFERSVQLRDKFRKLALEHDDTTWDPYA